MVNDIEKPKKKRRLIGHEILYFFLLLLGVLFLWLSIEFLKNPTPNEWKSTLFMGFAVACIPSGFLGLAYKKFLVSESVELLSCSLHEEVIDGIEKHLIHSIKNDLNPIINNLRITSNTIQDMVKFGVTRIYPNRNAAMKEFKHYIEEELKILYIVGSSLDGIFGEKDCNELKEIIQKKLSLSSFDIKFLVTHPALACLREYQEGRSEGDIANEIIKNLYKLIEIGIGDEFIKLYTGTPTNFIIFTSQKMLLNPYPYEKSARDSFCFVVDNVGEEGLYNQMYRAHFHYPWIGRNALPFSSNKIQELRKVTIKSSVDEIRNI